MDGYWEPTSQAQPRTCREPKQDDAQHRKPSEKELFVRISLEEVQAPPNMDLLDDLNGDSPAYLQESKHLCHPQSQL